MKLIYNLDLEKTRTKRVYSDPNNLSIYEDIEYDVIEISNIYTDIRIESDSYVILETEKLLVDISLIIECKMVGIIDYNDLRKYLIVNLLPNRNSLTDIEKSQLKSYYIVPEDYIRDSQKSIIYSELVKNATNCRKIRVDRGRSYVSLFYISDSQKSMDFFIDTEAMMNRFINGKIPELQAFINDENLAGYDYRLNGFSTKSYYEEELLDRLNYLLFR